MPDVKQLRYAALGLILIGLLLLGLASRKDVAVIVNGDVRTLTTSAFTVNGALNAAGVELASLDKSLPQPDAWLRHNAIIQVTQAVPVQVLADDEVVALMTAERMPANILALVGVPLFPNDRVLFQGVPQASAVNLPNAAAYTLQVQRAQRITLQIDNDVQIFSSAAPTLGEALWENGVQLFTADDLQPHADTPISGPLSVTLRRAQPLQIVHSAGTIDTRSSARTVGAALAEAGLPLQGLDYSIPAEGEALPDNGQVQLVRVAEEVVIEQEPLPFGVEFQAVDDLPLDSTAIVQGGEFGLQTQRVRIRMEDGEEVSRQVEDQWVAREPQPQIEGYGTQITIQTMETPHGTIEYYRAVEFYATSYSPARSGTSPDAPWYGITACGEPLVNGFVGVDLDYVPCGTQLYIPGYGFATAMDTGLIEGAWIDLGYTDEDFQLWHQYVIVYFLTPVPENFPLTIPPGTLK
ncbi:MAG: hypothetical protein DWQ07_13900 [Chloroflexi bacterium]|nr:MAG: hypothetical protein DWQ07_13900 [Chloroflexota bacterium]MBL1197429.1 hypothetical protein [Chloroflexota bacterium]NOH14724.1 DUF348 domain-containing protein [Chloroflexota bacterium]